MEFVRTPESRFVALPGYAFAEKYCEIDSGTGAKLRMHYLDEGPRHGRLLLCLHGEPTWSYLYRKMIPHFTVAGYRSIVPDLIGFGKSDKPVHRDSYTYERHVAWLCDFLDRLDFDEVVLVAQDWGGLIGLRALAERPERFRAAILANTFLPTGDEPRSEAFHRWRAASQRMREPFPAGNVLKRSCTPPLDDPTAAAYDAPFPDERYAAGARVFPMLVPADPGDRSSEPCRAAWRILETYTAPVLCAFSDGDPITRGADAEFRARIPGARPFAPVTIEGAGHFLQEDRPAEFAGAIVRFLASTIDASGTGPRVNLVDARDADFAWMLEDGVREDGLRFAPTTADDREVLAHVRGMTAALLRDHFYGSWMIVHEREVVGTIGYHRAPDVDGRVEIGYNVFQSRQRRGFMTAAVAELVTLALADGTVRVLVGETALANAPSQRVLAGNGFTRGDEHEDPHDGVLIRWTRDVR